MNKLLIALCLTASFGVSAEITDKEMVIIANHNYQAAIKHGVNVCKSVRETIDKLGGNSEIKESLFDLCLGSQLTIEKATKNKAEIDIIFQ